MLIYFCPMSWADKIKSQKRKWELFPKCVCVYVCVLVAQLCLTLCGPIDCSLQGSSAHEILEARILEWVAIFFSRGSSWPRDWTLVSCITGRSFTIWATREAVSTSYWWDFPAVLKEYIVVFRCVRLWDPMDYSPKGSSVRGISQARILESVSISFSRGSSQPRDWIPISCIGRQILYHWATRETPMYM